MAQERNSWLRRFGSAISGATTLWGFLPSGWQAAITAVFTAMTAGFGYATGGMFYALVGGSAVFAFGMMAAFFGLQIRNQTSIFEKISVQTLGIAGISFSPETKKIPQITLHGTFRNDSDRLIFFRFKRAYLSLQNRVAQNAILDKTIGILAKNVPQPFAMASIENIDIPADISVGVTGRIEIDIEYGPSRDDLRYLFKYASEPTIGLVYQDDKIAGATFSALVKELTHEEVSQ